MDLSNLMVGTTDNLIDPSYRGILPFDLIDRTVVICNTSSMPVAAREASIYTGVTIAEYYRQMGHDVLLLADSVTDRNFCSALKADFFPYSENPLMANLALL